MKDCRLHKTTAALQPCCAVLCYDVLKYLLFSPLCLLCCVRLQTRRLASETLVCARRTSCVRLYTRVFPRGRSLEASVDCLLHVALRCLVLRCSVLRWAVLRLVMRCCTAWFRDTLHCVGLLCCCCRGCSSRRCCCCGSVRSFCFLLGAYNSDENCCCWSCAASCLWICSTCCSSWRCCCCCCLCCC